MDQVGSSHNVGMYRAVAYSHELQCTTLQTIFWEVGFKSKQKNMIETPHARLPKNQGKKGSREWA